MLPVGFSLKVKWVHFEFFDPVWPICWQTKKPSVTLLLVGLVCAVFLFPYCSAWITFIIGEKNMESVNLTESLIKFRNVKGGCHLWSGHCTQCWKGKLNETISVASPIMTSALEHPGDGDVSSGWRWSTSNFVLVFVFFFSLYSRYRWLPSRRGGVSGFGVPPASMRRAADQNGGGGRHNWGQGFRLGDQWGACPPAMLSRWQFPPSTGHA